MVEGETFVNEEAYAAVVVGRVDGENRRSGVAIDRVDSIKFPSGFLYHDNVIL